MKNNFTIVLTILTLLFSLSLSAQSDLSVHYINYSNGEVIPTDTIYTDFYLKNHGNINYHHEDTIYVSAKINGTYFGLDLMGNKTAIVLEDHFHTGDSLIKVTGYLVGSQTLPFFPGATTLNICIVVWGKGIASVDVANGTFPSDSGPSNNTTCVTYDPAELGITTLEENKITVYPNPASSEITFDFSGSVNSRIVISNSLGQVVTQEEFTGKTTATVNVSSLNAGIYQYSIFDANGQKSAIGKFIKQ